MYAVTGGVPKYIELFCERSDVYRSIQDCVVNPSGYLYGEPYFLLQQEVTEIGSYFSVIKAIAAGNRKLSSISTVLEIKATSLTKYLKTLIDLDILEREVPVTEENPEKSKKGLYKIKDNYIRFWFAFVYPNRSFIESGNSRIVMDKIRKGVLSSHTAFVYEDICREKCGI
ncbi:MAG: ATP-binding protein [Coprococcus sp.]|nr:ATP-binding protein [Coprococcus sp.]